jgi:hypothetical protein
LANISKKIGKDMFQNVFIASLKPGTNSPPPSNPTTWDPATATPGLVFSNGNLTVSTNQFNIYYNARSDTSVSTGKKYVEVTGYYSFVLGLATSGWNSADGNSWPGDGLTSWGIWPNGPGTPASLFYNGNPTALTEDIDATTTPTLGLAIDFDTGKFWFRTSVGWQGDPAAETGEIATFTPNTPLYVITSIGGDGASTTGFATANFGASSFLYAVPSGYTAWNA